MGPAAPDPDHTRTGVCVVRVETDASAGLLITVTARADVADQQAETVLRTADVDRAVGQVDAFLRAFRSGRN